MRVGLRVAETSIPSSLLSKFCISFFPSHLFLISYSLMFQVIKLIHLTEVYHFHAMIDMLVKCGYKKGTTLFGYGYDFRQSNR